MNRLVQRSGLVILTLSLATAVLAQEGAAWLPLGDAQH